MTFTLEFSRESPRLSEGTMDYADGLFAAIRLLRSYWQDGWRLTRIRCSRR